MTLEQYKAKLDEELKAMDWHERDIKNSRAYKVLSAAALDRENVPMEEWLKLNAYFYKRVKELQGCHGMDGTQCAHVFEITQPECLVCAGRNRSCEKFVERRMSDEKENESCDRDRPDAGQCGATDVLVRADRPTRVVGAWACAAGSDHPAARAAGQRESGCGDGAGSQRDTQRSSKTRISA